MGRKLFVAALTLGFLYLVAPFLLPVIMGAVFGVIFMPLQRDLERRKVPRRLASLLLTVAVAFIVLLPISLLLFAGVKAGMQQLQVLKSAAATTDGSVTGDWVSSLMKSPFVVRISDLATHWFPINVNELGTTIRDLGEGIAKKATEILGLLLAQLPGMVLDLVLIVVSLFFFLADGRQLIQYVRRQSVFSERETEKLFLTIRLACRSVLLAALASAIAQAAIELVALWSTGIPNAALFGLIVFVASFIPVIGSVPVTLGITLQQFMSGHTGAGVVLLIAAIIVGAIDNVVRALFLKGTVNLHPLLAFTAALGGLQALGFPGIFIGPILAVLLVAVLQTIDVRGARH